MSILCGALCMQGEVMSLNNQITRFEDTTLPELKAVLGFASMHQLSNRKLSKYLFVVGTGGNDYLLNYFSRHITHNRTTLSGFTHHLISTLSAQLKVATIHIFSHSFLLFQKG